MSVCNDPDALFNMAMQKPIVLFPMAKREYKTKMNGHGIEIWNCRQCDYPLDNVSQRGQKKVICNHCSIENRALRERMRIFSNKVMKVLYP